MRGELRTELPAGNKTRYLSNFIVMNHLESILPGGVKEFKHMVEKTRLIYQQESAKVWLKKILTKWSMSLGMKPLWENTRGKTGSWLWPGINCVNCTANYKKKKMNKLFIFLIMKGGEGLPVKLPAGYNNFHFNATAFTRLYSKVNLPEKYPFNIARPIPRFVL